MSVHSRTVRFRVLVCIKSIVRFNKVHRRLSGTLFLILERLILNVSSLVKEDINIFTSRVKGMLYQVT